MLILGIVGSPRKDGRSNALVGAALDGAAAQGAETRVVYLIDSDVRPYGMPGTAPCCPESLSSLCDQADALVIGAPVYWGDINGLTKDFMDSVQLQRANGKPAAGAAIAGGSGKGLISGVQSIYHFFYHRQFCAIDPTPVSRFNFDTALAALRETGARLVEMARNPIPFPGANLDGRWGAVLAHYVTLPCLTQGPLDEFVLLARQLIAISSSDAATQAQQHLDQALVLRASGQDAEAARHAVRAYELLYFNE
jgi:NAD(P)H-dependent FMN reductase